MAVTDRLPLPPDKANFLVRKTAARWCDLLFVRFMPMDQRVKFARWRQDWYDECYRVTGEWTPDANP